MSVVYRRAAQINGVTEVHLNNSNNISANGVTLVNGSSAEEITANSGSSKAVIKPWFSHTNNNSLEFMTHNGETINAPIITRPLRAIGYGIYMVSCLNLTE